MLGLQAVELAGPGSELSASQSEVLWRSILEDRFLSEIDLGFDGDVHFALAPDDSALFAASATGGVVRGYTFPDGELLWEHHVPGVDIPGLIWSHPDGSRVAFGVIDSDADFSLVREGQEDETDDFPNRLVVLDSTDGAVIDQVDFPCLAADPFGWSPDGAVFGIGSGGANDCPRPEAPDGVWVEVLDGISLESIAIIPTHSWGVVPLFDVNNRLFGLAPEADTFVAEPPAYTQLTTIPDSQGVGDITVDGSLAALFANTGGGLGVRLFDLDAGAGFDRLDAPQQPSLPVGLRFSRDGSLLIGGTQGEVTIVWDAGSGSEIARLPSGFAAEVGATSDNAIVVTSQTDGTIKLWDMRSAGGRTSLGDTGRHTWINGNSLVDARGVLAFDAYDLSGVEDGLDFGEIHLADPETGEIVTVIPQSNSPQSLADGRILYWRLGESRVFDPRTGESYGLVGCVIQPDYSEICRETGEPAEEWNVTVSLDGTEVFLMGNGEEDLVRIDPADGSVLSSEPKPDWDPWWIAPSWLGAFDGQSVRFVQRGTLDELWNGGSIVPNVDEISPSISYAAFADWSALKVHIVDLRTWDVRSNDVDPGRVRGLSFNDSETLVAVSSTESLTVYDIATWERVASVPIPGVSDVHWFDDENVAIGTWDGEWSRLPLRGDELIRATRNSLQRSFTDRECTAFRIEPCPTLDEIRSR